MTTVVLTHLELRLPVRLDDQCFFCHATSLSESYPQERTPKEEYPPLSAMRCVNMRSRLTEDIILLGHLQKSKREDATRLKAENGFKSVI